MPPQLERITTMTEEKNKAEELTPAHYQQKRRAYPLPRLEDATTENKNPGGGFYNQIIL